MPNMLWNNDTFSVSNTKQNKCTEMNATTKAYIFYNFCLKDSL